jgi:hypothetical protein
MLTKQFVRGLDPKRRPPGEAATERQPLALYFLGPEEDLKHVLAIWEARRRDGGDAGSGRPAAGGCRLGRRDGARQGAAAVEGAAFLAQVAALNDARAMADKCRRTQRQEKGGVACDLPPVWVRR